MAGRSKVEALDALHALGSRTPITLITVENRPFAIGGSTDHAIYDLMRSRAIGPRRHADDDRALEPACRLTVLATSLVHTICSPSPHADAAVGSWLCRPQP